MKLISPALGVVKYVAIVQNNRGGRFRVFTTGDPKYYLFDALVPGTDCSGGLMISVEASSLRDDIRSALKHGWGNSQ